MNSLKSTQWSWLFSLVVGLAGCGGRSAQPARTPVDSALYVLRQSIDGAQDDPEVQKEEFTQKFCLPAHRKAVRFLEANEEKKVFARLPILAAIMPARKDGRPYLTVEWLESGFSSAGFRLLDKDKRLLADVKEIRWSQWEKDTYKHTFLRASVVFLAENDDEKAALEKEKSDSAVVVVDKSALKKPIMLEMAGELEVGAEAIEVYVAPNFRNKNGGESGGQ